MIGELVVAASSAKPLPGVFHTLEPYLRHYGYLAVGGALFLEDFGVPVPGETMLIAAALYAGTGRLSIWVVVVVGVVAAVLGDNVGYAIGATGGRRLVDRFGKYVFLTPERMDKAEGFFARNGGKVVVIARFVEGLRQANGIIAGMSEMTWRRFALFNVIGATLWVATWATLGYVAGNHVETVSKYGTYVSIGLAVVIVGAFAIRAWRKRRKQRARPST